MGVTGFGARSKWSTAAERRRGSTQWGGPHAREAGARAEESPSGCAEGEIGSVEGFGGGVGVEWGSRLRKGKGGRDEQRSVESPRADGMGAVGWSRVGLEEEDAGEEKEGEDGRHLSAADSQEQRRFPALCRAIIDELGVVGAAADEVDSDRPPGAQPLPALAPTPREREAERGEQRVRHGRHRRQEKGGGGLLISILEYRGTIDS
eukprot:scaffold140884_cov29-Tisochrysis_lutea.AAC.1